MLYLRWIAGALDTHCPTAVVLANPSYVMHLALGSLPVRHALTVLKVARMVFRAVLDEADSSNIMNSRQSPFICYMNIQTMCRWDECVHLAARMIDMRTREACQALFLLSSNQSPEGLD